MPGCASSCSAIIDWSHDDDVRVKSPGYDIISPYGSDEGIVTGDGPGRQNLVGWLQADDSRYRWLNDIVCIAEGWIGDGGMQIHVYAGLHELEA